MGRVILSCLLVMALRPMDAAACECSFAVTAAEAGSASVIFKGRVTRVTLRWGPALWLGLHDRFANQVEVEFDVSRVWRGDVASSTVVTTGLGGGDCGYEFRVGEEYVVPASDTGEGLSTSICSGVESRWDGPSSLSAAAGWPPPLPVPTSAGPSVFLLAYTAVSVGVLAVLGAFLGASGRPGED